MAPEGPGNYGLNKDCLMTIVTAKDNTVVANFALVQPGIADAPKVLAALAKPAATEPPTAKRWPRSPVDGATVEARGRSSRLRGKPSGPRIAVESEGGDARRELAARDGAVTKHEGEFSRRGADG